MKKMRLFLLSALLLALSLPTQQAFPTLSCSRAACEASCGGPGMGVCLNNECQCY
jgi:hypothetical protein